MTYEASYGIIPLENKANIWHVLLIQHGAGHWGFPKGHPEDGEEPRQTAARELQEETGLTVFRFLTALPLIEKYQFFVRHQRIEKTVTYFLAEVVGDVVLQVEEVQAFKWVPLAEAATFVTFPAAKALCHQVQQRLDLDK